MAASRFRSFHSLFSNFNNNNIGWFHVTKPYSQYAPIFKEPIFQRDEVKATIKKMTDEEIKTLRVKAPTNSQHCFSFYDPLVSKLINKVMVKGNKEKARELVSKAFAHIKHIQIRKYNQEKDEAVRSEIELDPKKILYQALEKSTPRLSVTKIKKSGTWYNVPVGINPEQARKVALKWIVHVSRDKPQDMRFYKTLGEELLASSQENGKATNKKLELHKLCETNRSYAHYQWT